MLVKEILMTIFNVNQFLLPAIPLTRQYIVVVTCVSLTKKCVFINKKIYLKPQSCISEKPESMSFYGIKDEKGKKTFIRQSSNFLLLNSLESETDTISKNLSSSSTFSVVFVLQKL